MIFENSLYSPSTLRVMPSLWGTLLLIKSTTFAVTWVKLSSGEIPALR